VLDSTAISLCMENDLPILVINLWKADSIEQAVLGEPVGTIIYR
jgi:uridylate kinase